MKIKYTKEYGLKRLKEFHSLLGKIPNRQDFKNYKWLPTESWYYNNFTNEDGEKSYQQACYEAGIGEKPIKKVIKKKCITEKAKKLIDEIILNNPDTEFKKCINCGREFPNHKMFYTINSMYKDGLQGKCRECCNEKSNFLFDNEYDKLHIIPWYIGKEDEIKHKYRYMEYNELANYYNVSKQDIKNVIRNMKLGGLSKNREDYTEDEVLYMYNAYKNKKKDAFPNGFSRVYKYKIFLIKHLVIDILKYTDKKILCENFNFGTIDENNMSIIRANADPFKVLCDAFPEYNIKRWELKNSGMPQGFWKDKNNLDEAINWFLSKLKIEKNINTIYEAKEYGFVNLLNEYNIDGLCQQTYRSKKDFFECIYNEKLIDYCNIDNDNIERKLQGEIYDIKDDYNELDYEGKYLINEIIRYCEENYRYPILQDLSNKNGFVSYGRHIQYFGNIENINKYIIPIDLKPETMKCRDCGEILPFTNEYFLPKEGERYGLLYQCKKCASKYVMKKSYKKYGIILENDVKEIKPEKWWEYVYNGVIPKMPDFCFEDNNVVLIIRHVVLNVLKLKSKLDICENLITSKFHEWKISALYGKFNSRNEMILKCFPEMNFTEEDFNIYSDTNMNRVINDWVLDNNITVEQILNCSENCNTSSFNSKMSNLYVSRFRSVHDMFIWYFNYNNIRHPQTLNSITVLDFKNKPMGFFDVIENRVICIKKYCEKDCTKSIATVLNDVTKLKKWIRKYFTQDKINSNIGYGFSNGYKLLTEAYPEIISYNLLFEWEWHTTITGLYTKENLVKILRQLVEFRMDDIIKDYEKDIPIYLNATVISFYCSKISKFAFSIFGSFYNWAIESFPEYKNIWKASDFGVSIAFDGTECSSKQEMVIYEFIKKKSNVNIIAVGKERSGKNIFVYKEGTKTRKLCPDFIIDSVGDTKLDKRIVIEYFGLYTEQNYKSSELLTNYYNKAKKKIKYFNENEEIHFISLFPEDLKNNMQGVREKLTSFFMQNFNISINKVA